MICVSLDERWGLSFLKSLDDVEFAEIRMDRMNLTNKDIKEIFSQPKRLIATCRPGYLNENKRLSYLLNAIEAGSSYVDIELESDSRFKKPIVDLAHKKGCTVIISHHDYIKTPSQEALNGIVRLCFVEGADIAKIACKVNSTSDAARLIGILGNKDFENKVIVAGMGDKGRLVRVIAPFLGGVFTYASMEKGKETAEGQIENKRLKRVFEVLKNV
ncbi:MAG TPA: type I 3-dehydroquinate dehydratase [Syntrophorhabdaceae bacterium]|nr:type I 3-dehydroquinate dehydratase [Syntrophorhabdaceae bacterium]HPP42675.1 type I 3-dehydroquinate dehydratase [Syntrophorhabdaceae bacterium]